MATPVPKALVDIMAILHRFTNFKEMFSAAADMINPVNNWWAIKILYMELLHHTHTVGVRVSCCRGSDHTQQ